MIFIKNVFFKILNFKILPKSMRYIKLAQNRNCMQNFSSLAFKGEAVDVAQISVNGGGGTRQTELFFLL
jgi:hypothetical protein